MPIVCALHSYFTRFFQEIAAAMGKDRNFSGSEKRQSSCQRAEFDRIRVHITILTDRMVTGPAGPSHPLQYPKPAIQVITERLRTPIGTTQSPPLMWFSSFQDECDTSDERKEEYPTCQSTFNSEWRLDIDLLGPQSSAYLSSLNGQPWRIPGLYLPSKQSLFMVIFGQLYAGQLEPQAESEYMSLSLWDLLQEKWPEDAPAALLPLYFPCSPQGPAAVHLSKKADFPGTFILGRSTYRRFQTMAMRAIDGELAYAMQNSSTSHRLDFLQRSLNLHDFKDVKTLVSTGKQFRIAADFPQPPAFLVMPGQRLCYRQDGNQLVAIARDRGMPTELVALGVPFDHGLDECAHLATIAFRESVAKADEAIGSNRCKVKVLVISKDCEAVIEEIYRRMPKEFTRRSLPVRSLDGNYGLDRNYELVVTLMAGLEANPMKGYFSV